MKKLTAYFSKSLRFVSLLFYTTRKNKRELSDIILKMQRYNIDPDFVESLVFYYDMFKEQDGMKIDCDETTKQFERKYTGYRREKQNIFAFVEEKFGTNYRRFMEEFS